MKYNLIITDGLSKENYIVDLEKVNYLTYKIEKKGGIVTFHFSEKENITIYFSSKDFDKFFLSL